jgi:hypothetical protein
MSLIISIDDIGEEMILAEPIINNFGQTLINSGCKLQEKHKKILKMWNIKVVMIKENGSEENNELSEELKQLSMDKLNKRMNWQPRNSIEQDLYWIGILRTSQTFNSNDS